MSSYTLDRLAHYLVTSEMHKHCTQLFTTRHVSLVLHCDEEGSLYSADLMNDSVALTAASHWHFGLYKSPDSLACNFLPCFCTELILNIQNKQHFCLVCEHVF